MGRGGWKGAPVEPLALWAPTPWLPWAEPPQQSGSGTWAASHQGRGAAPCPCPSGQAGFCRSDPKPTRKIHPPSGVPAPHSRHCCPPEHREQKMGKSHEAGAPHSSRPLPGNDRALCPPPACVHAPLREHLLLRRPSVRAWRLSHSGKAGPAPPGPSDPQQVPARMFSQALPSQYPLPHRDKPRPPKSPRTAYNHHLHLRGSWHPKVDAPDTARQARRRMNLATCCFCCSSAASSSLLMPQLGGARAS